MLESFQVACVKMEGCRGQSSECSEGQFEGLLGVLGRSREPFGRLEGLLRTLKDFLENCAESLQSFEGTLEAFEGFLEHFEKSSECSLENSA